MGRFFYNILEEWKALQHTDEKLWLKGLEDIYFDEKIVKLLGFSFLL